MGAAVTTTTDPLTADDLELLVLEGQDQDIPCQARPGGGHCTMPAVWRNRAVHPDGTRCTDTCLLCQYHHDYLDAQVRLGYKVLTCNAHHIGPCTIEWTRL